MQRKSTTSMYHRHHIGAIRQNAQYVHLKIISSQQWRPRVKTSPCTWDETIQQINICLNLLRPSTDDPTISAYQGIFGTIYDFLPHPTAPVGTPVLIYRTPEERASWADHGVEGFFIGSVLNSYRSFSVYVTQPRNFRTTDTLAWFPEQLRMHTIYTSADTLAIGDRQLTPTQVTSTHHQDDIIKWLP